MANEIQGGGLPRGRPGAAVAAALLAAAVLAAYWGVLGCPFVLDDGGSISENPSIRGLARSLLPPPGTPVSGRPLLNLTFAANYAVGALDVRGYHAFNLGVHFLAALVLFGLAARTFSRPPLERRFGPDARLLGLAAALLWALHPLQTEAVTYVSQRAETLMALFYLLTLACFERADGSKRPGLWLAASVLSCLLGSLVKEVIASAPLVVLLYDRTFCAGSFAGALRRRWRYYLGLASSWVLLALLALGHGRRGVGFGTGVGPWEYALTSCRSVATYLGLAAWPHPLVFDYGTEIVRSPAAVWPQALVVAALVTAGAAALRFRPAAGFAIAWFLLILAPTTSFIPAAGQPMAEHREYLPLAAPACAAVLGLYALMGRRGLLAAAALAAVLGTLTHLRNADYRSEESLWTDTLRKRPGNARAHTEYGTFLMERPGSLGRATREFEEALRLAPGFTVARTRLGIALARTPGRLDEGIALLEGVVRADPGDAWARDNLGIALAGAPGRLDEAIAEFRGALATDPRLAQAHNDLGLALAGLPGRRQEAVAEYREALRLDPGLSQAHNDLGVALAASPGTEQEAVAEYREALRLRPGYAEAHNNLGAALARAPGGLPEAIAEYDAALRANPDFAQAQNNLGAALAALPGRGAEALAHYEAALRLKPDYAEAHNNLGLALAAQPGRLPDAIGHLREAVRIDPAYAEAHNNLGLALSQEGHSAEAIAQFRESIRLMPGNAEAHNNLGIALAGTPGGLPDASAQFEEALRIRPGYPDAARNLETARRMLGQAADRP